MTPYDANHGIAVAPTLQQRGPAAVRTSVGVSEPLVTVEFWGIEPSTHHMDLTVTAVRTGVSAPMGSGLVKGRGRTGPLVGLWLMAERDGGEKARTAVRSWLACTHSGPGGGVRRTVSPDPGCSVRSTAVLQAHAETRARPVPAFSDVASS